MFTYPPLELWSQSFFLARQRLSRTLFWRRQTEQGVFVCSYTLLRQIPEIPAGDIVRSRRFWLWVAGLFIHQAPSRRRGFHVLAAGRLDTQQTVNHLNSTLGGSTKSAAIRLLVLGSGGSS